MRVVWYEPVRNNAPAWLCIPFAGPSKNNRDRDHTGCDLH
jgi:hypothetical protein